MRQAPQMRVEVAGIATTRPGVVQVLRSDSAGTITCVRPQLEPGETLLERPGMIPEIIKEADMPKPVNAPTDRERRRTFRDEMVRAVVGACPAIQAKEASPLAIDSMCRQLVDAESAKAMLRANGYGRNTDSITDMVRTLLTGERKRA
jgi:hypothetical protein